MEHKPPTVVCICGSGKFWEEMQRQRRQLTQEGKIVLGPEVRADGTSDADADHNPNKPSLDELHLRKIDISDEVLVVDKDTLIPGSTPYVGSSTTKEIDYAKGHGVPLVRLSEISN
jgi:hypothetical protein